MPKNITFPLYIARDPHSETPIIAGPSTDCQRMMIAAASYRRFEGGDAEVVYLCTASAPEAVRLGKTS